jgi:hypothetical protein
LLPKVVVQVSLERLDSPPPIVRRGSRLRASPGFAPGSLEAVARPRQDDNRSVATKFVRRDALVTETGAVDRAPIRARS